MSFPKIYRVFLLISLIFLVSFPAEASYCRDWNGHSICIISIKRSAKYYWEYRGVVSVDGVKTREIYNCRDRTKIKEDKTVVDFEKGDAGELICSRFKK